MRIPPSAATLVLLAALPAPGSAAVIDEPYTPLIIRLYDNVDGARAGDAAVEEAHAILVDAGFAPEWVRCTAAAPPAKGHARCAAPLGGAELAVRLAARTAGEANRDAARSAPNWRQPLGYSLIDPRTKSGALATIYLDRVSWLAGESGAGVPVLLGRAIAHEIGHLLLGTTQHAHVGVMRAVWSREAVRNSRASEWRFLKAEARRMRRAVLARSAVGTLASHIVWGD